MQSRPEDIYRCQTPDCGFMYDPAKGDKRRGVEPGTAFEDLPHDWSCPICGATKKNFRPLRGPGSGDDEG